MLGQRSVRSLGSEEGVTRLEGSGAEDREQVIAPQDDLFAKELIASLVDDRRFVPRQWLVDRVQEHLDGSDARFVLLTGEPGAGKSALMAHLARLHPEAPRYFIRRDSMTPLRGGDARTFLFALGHQLASLHPSLFEPQRLEVVIRQRAERVASGGQMVGIEVEDLLVSPFHDTAIRVEQHAAVVEGDLVGISANRMIDNPRLQELSNLQYLALLDPAEVLAEQDPAARIVVLVDALDEIRYGLRGEDVLAWLTSCPELPSNVRFVLTSRPDADLLSSFRAVKGSEIVELAIDPDAEGDRDSIREDLHRYLDRFAAEPAVTEAMVAYEVEPTSFVDGAADRAQGNFQYVVALARGIDAALGSEPPSDDLPVLLRLEGIPAGTQELYRFFLGRIKEQADRAPVKVPTGPMAEPEERPAWEALYHPVLAVLAVAFEPLAAEQLVAYASAPPGALPRAMEAMAQFMDPLPDGRYRLYHATFPEFLTGEETGGAADPFHVDPATWHGLLAGRLLRANPDWLACEDDYALAHTPAHLAEAIAVRSDDGGRKELTAALTSLTMDPTWLRRSLNLLDVDRLADILATANLTASVAAIDAVARVLRRSRVSLSEDPDQLAAQLYARLKREDDPSLQLLIENVMEVAPPWWLRVQTSGLEWRSDDASFPISGTVRALAIGQAEDGSVLAIGIDDRIELWSLKRGPQGRDSLSNDGARVTALSVGRTGQGTVLVVAAGYDNHVVVRDLRSGNVVGPVFELPEYADSVAIGFIRDKQVVAASGNDRAWAWEVDNGDPVPLAGPQTGHGRLVSISTVGGRLVCILEHPDDDGRALCSVMDAHTGERLWEARRCGWLMVTPSSGRPNFLFTEVGGTPVAAGCLPPSYVELWSSADREHLGNLDIGEAPLRAWAIGDVDGRVFVAGASEYQDHPDTGFVHFSELGGDWDIFPEFGAEIYPGWVDHEILGLRSAQGDEILALTEDWDPWSERPDRRLKQWRVFPGGRLPTDDWTERLPNDDPPDPLVVGAYFGGTNASTGSFSTIDVRGARLVDIGDRVADDSASIGGLGRLSRRDPSSWPVTAECRGFVAGDPVVARGSYGGAVWLWDLQTGQVRAGPFESIPDELALPNLAFKGRRPIHVTGLALGPVGGRDVIATACDGRVRLWDASSASEIPAPPMGSVLVVSLALGELQGRDVLVTGSLGGQLTIFDAERREKLANIRLDSDINGVWVVRDLNTVGALTADDELQLFDLVQGSLPAASG